MRRSSSSARVGRATTTPNPAVGLVARQRSDKPTTMAKQWPVERLRQLHLGACHNSSERIAVSLGLDHSFADMIDRANQDCHGCTIGKGRVKLPKATAPDGASVATHFNDRISLDYIIGLGGWQVLVILDDYSRFVRIVCLRHRDAESTLTAFREHWEANYYLPRRQRHDNDGGFVDLDAFLSASGCQRERIPPHTPELDGQNERSHGTLMDMFRSVMAHSGLPHTDPIRRYIIEHHVPNVYNNIVHSATGEAPIARAFPGQIANLEAATAYYPGRPVVFKPKPEALHVQRGRPNWQPGRAVCQVHSNLAIVIDENRRIWQLATGRIQFKDAFASKARAEMDRQPAEVPLCRRAPWDTTGPPITIEDEDQDDDRPVDVGESESESNEYEPPEEEGEDSDDKVDVDGLPSRENGQQRQTSSGQRPLSEPPPPVKRDSATRQRSSDVDYWDYIEFKSNSPSVERTPAHPAVSPPAPPAPLQASTSSPHFGSATRTAQARAHAPVQPYQAGETSDYTCDYYPRTGPSKLSPMAYALGAVPASALTPEERCLAEKAEIDGWKQMNVFTEVPTHQAKAICRAGNGAIISTRWVYSRKPPTTDFPQGQPKARCVARGFQDQRPDIDSNSPAASSDSRRCFIAVARMRRHCVVIADVKQAYLNADLHSQSSVFLIPPPGHAPPNTLWKLNKAVYGLADAGVMWYECISSRLLAKGWKRLPEDPCVYVKRGMVAVLYVDDLLVAAGTDKQASDEIAALQFKLGKGRPIRSGDEFAGITITFQGDSFQTAATVALTQRKYTETAIADPVWTRRAPTPLPVTLTQRDRKQEKELDAIEHRAYRGIVGKIQWLCCTTRPDMAYAGAYLSRSLAAPTDKDFQLADRCAAYAKETAELCLTFPTLDGKTAEIVVISDASHAAPRDDYRSQSGYLILIADRKHCALISWKSGVQKRRVTSSMAAECYAAKAAWQQGIHLQRLINGMCPDEKPLTTRCAVDNDDLYKIVKLRKRSVPKDRSLTICVHMLREIVDDDGLTVAFVEGRVNPADALTKPLTDATPLLQLMRGAAANMGAEVDPIGKKRTRPDDGRV